MKPRAPFLYFFLNYSIFFSFFLIEGVWVGVEGWAGLRLLMKFSPASPSSSSASLLFLISCLMGSHVIMFQSSWEHPPPPPPPPTPLRLNDWMMQPARRWNADAAHTNPAWLVPPVALLCPSVWSRLNSSCQCSDEPAHFITLWNCFPFSVIFFSEWKTPQCCGINQCLFYDTVEPNVSLVSSFELEMAMKIPEA